MIATILELTEIQTVNPRLNDTQGAIVRFDQPVRNVVRSEHARLQPKHGRPLIVSFLPVRRDDDGKALELWVMTDRLEMRWSPRDAAPSDLIGATTAFYD